MRADNKEAARRSGRAVWLILAGVILAFAAWEVVYAVRFLSWPSAFGADLRLYTDATVRLLTGGGWYLDRQLHGPYPVEGGDVLYPPVTAWIFLPFVVVGMAGYLALWAGVMAWAVRGSRPWTWPLIALCIAWPPSLLAIWSGNPSGLVAVAVALAFRWPGFGALVLLKPTMLPFAAVGIRSRAWWLTLGLLAVASLPFLADTLLYPRVLLWSQSPNGIAYSLWHYPLALIPVIATSSRLAFTVPRRASLSAIRTGR